MVIVVYSSQTDSTIRANTGIPDYSYYFVLKKFRTVLWKFATVIEVRNPEKEVDVIYRMCRLKGEACLFFSFTPPFKTITGLQCPTISVFAWEYTTIPTDVWNNDPRNDWRYVFRKHKCAITHSSFAVKAVKKAMGNAFPIWSIPAPVWDDYAKLYKLGKTYAQSGEFDLTVDGTFIDFDGCDAPFIPEENKKDFTQQRSFTKGDKEVGVNLHLKGIIYTAVFNPGDGRKNLWDMLKGFIWAFRKLDDVTLVLKVVSRDFEGVQKLLTDEIYKLTPFKCRVVIVHGYLDDYEYAKLVLATTYVVNTAHGEGQCLPLMEYMSAGKPAVAPSHTAMEDYISERNAFVVKSSLEITYWPDDPRNALRTMRYRLNWESLYNAFLESYQVAKKDPVRYAEMSACAVKSLKKYCSEAVVIKRLKKVFRERGALNEGGLHSSQMRVWPMVSRLIRLLN